MQATGEANFLTGRRALAALGRRPPVAHDDDCALVVVAVVVVVAVAGLAVLAVVASALPRQGQSVAMGPIAMTCAYVRAD
jgi:hypothetical protein